MQRLLLIRHGQSVWNADGRWQGQADPPLTPLGEEQARAALRRLGPVAAISTSDLVRARRTADIIGHALGIEPTVDTRLRERHAGPWQGRTRAEIEREWPDYLASGRRPPGFEDDESVLVRARDALTAIAVPDELDVLVVTHGGIVRSLERALNAPSDGLLPNLGGRWIFRDGPSLALGSRTLLLDEHDDRGVEITRPEQI